MWKASAGHQTNNVVNNNNDDDDDWETDPDFVNDVSEEEQRWGSKTIEGSGRTAGAINMQQLRDETEKSDADMKKKHAEDLNIGFGYGGKFGIEKNRVDKCAEGWDYKEKVVKHCSQKDYSDGFGGKYGVQNDRVDKSAVGWDHMEKVEKHNSQKDYSKGFGGKFGVENDRVDKSAVGWDYVEAPQKHESQIDHKIGFGGKFGVQNDRMDKSAIGFTEQNDKIGTNYTKVKPDIGSAKPSNLRAKFENFAKSTEEDTKRKADEQKRIREEKDKLDREEAAKRTEFETSGEDKKISTTRKTTYVETGRTGGIGSAISAFNQIQSPVNEQQPSFERKAPIKLPKQIINEEIKNIEKVEEPVVVEQEKVVIPQQKVQPDLIPESEIRNSDQPVIENEEIIIKKTEIEEEPIYNNTQFVAPPAAFTEQQQQQQPIVVDTIISNQSQSQEIIEEPIYQNQENISEYIDDTGIKAIALYDYQAAADDEISFDPDDIITHIEMIDEGWWRGLSKNRYGLFPANYVQLVEQQQT